MELDATIAAIHQETPTVKSFVLDLGGQSLPFLPGQYVDVIFGPPGEHYAGGGYSMTSSPLLKGVIHLAVKKVLDEGDSAALHERARVGDPALVTGPAGDFYYERGAARSVVLIAGGIGITPLMSMLHYVDEAEPDTLVTLLYSAQTPSELAFREELEAMAARNPNIRCLFTVTRPGKEPWNGRVGRIDRQLLVQCTSDRETVYYVCGPPHMRDAITELLGDLGVDHSRVKSEQW